MGKEYWEDLGWDDQEYYDVERKSDNYEGEDDQERP